MSGIEMLAAMIAGKLPRAPTSETLDFLLIRIEPGVALFQGRPHLKHYNPLGAVHGGWFATLLDSAMGCAVQSTLPAGKGYTTMEFKVNLVRALTEAIPVVRAEGKGAFGAVFGDGGGAAVWAGRETICARVDDLHRA